MEQEGDALGLIDRGDGCNAVANPVGDHIREIAKKLADVAVHPTTLVRQCGRQFPVIELLERESLNSLLDTLQEWETVLKTCNSLIHALDQDNDPRCDDEHFRK